MMKQIKFSMKMYRYCYGLKANCVGALLVLALGLVLETKIFNAFFSFTTVSQPDLLGSFFLCLSGTFFAQAWQSFNTTGIVLSSPRHMSSMCFVPTFIVSVSTIAGFTLLLFIRLLSFWASPCDTSIFAGNLILTTLCVLLLMVYFAVSYRYFVLSTILFFLCFYTLLFAAPAVMQYLPAPPAIPVTIAVCYCILFLGVALLYAISLLLYKKPLSKLALGASLRRYL